MTGVVSLKNEIGVEVMRVQAFVSEEIDFELLRSERVLGNALLIAEDLDVITSVELRIEQD